MLLPIVSSCLREHSIKFVASFAKGRTSRPTSIFLTTKLHALHKRLQLQLQRNLQSSALRCKLKEVTNSHRMIAWCARFSLRFGNLRSCVSTSYQSVTIHRLRAALSSNIFRAAQFNWFAATQTTKHILSSALDISVAPLAKCVAAFSAARKSSEFRRCCPLSFLSLFSQPRVQQDCSSKLQQHECGQMITTPSSNFSIEASYNNMKFTSWRTL